MAEKVYEIDGTEFSTLEEFYDHFQARVLGSVAWGRNLDALNDVLSGGFGTPDDGFVLRWVNHWISCERLGYAETIRQLELKRLQCHSTAIPIVEEELQQARMGNGSTVFDWLVEIMRTRVPRAGYPEVKLILE